MEIAMDCEKIKELLPFYGDSSLDSGVENMLRDHIRNCPDCQREFEEIKSVNKMVSDVFLTAPLEPMPDFLGEVHRKIKEKKKTKVVFYRATAVAAVVLMTVTTFLFGYMNFNTVDQSMEYAEEEISVDSDDTLATLLVNQDLSVYDLNELVDDSEEETVSDEELFDAVFTGSSDSMSAHALMNVLDEDDVTLVLASY